MSKGTNKVFNRSTQSPITIDVNSWVFGAIMMVAVGQVCHAEVSTIHALLGSTPAWKSVQWMFVVAIGFCGCRHFGYLVLKTASVVVAELLPSIDGYCYTLIFHPDHRLAAAFKLGASPKWSEVIRQPGINPKQKFAIEVIHTSSGKLRRHTDGDGTILSTHVVECDCGFRPVDLSRDYLEYHVGASGQRLRVPQVWTVLALHRAMRVFLWLVIMGKGTYFQLSIMAGVVMVCRRKGVQYFETVCACLVILVPTLSYTAFAIIIAQHVLLNMGAQMASHTVYLRQYCNSVREPPLPWDGDFGIQGRGFRHNVIFSTRNPNYTLENFKMDESMGGTSRELFQSQTHQVNSVTVRTGNTHPEAAQATRWFLHNIIKTNDSNRHILNVGGTWQGWGETPSGVFLQPNLGVRDSARLADHPTREYLGQFVISDHIGTNCRPVGSVREQFDVGVNFDGIGGALVVMVHVYDVPIKALLALAYGNNSSDVIVVMHGSPSLFEHTSGILPWTKQRFVHKDDGNTYWEWESTSGEGWSHNTRIHYEHFWTSSVQVAPGVWYNSHIDRSVFDCYMIRWTRSDTAPGLELNRTLNVSLPFGETEVPAVQETDAFGRVFIVRQTTQVSMAEYLMTSRTLADAQVSLRAMTDNFYRNRDMMMRHFDHETLVGMWKAEGIRRELVAGACPREEAAHTLFSVLGLAPDAGVTAHLCTLALKLHMQQPLESTRRPLIRQTGSYVSQIDNLPAVVSRVVPFTPLSGETYISQMTIDVRPVRSWMELRCDGRTMAMGFAYALYGRFDSIGPVLPCGDPDLGGSVLAVDGAGFLVTEINWLLEHAMVCVIVRQNGANAGEIDHLWYGRTIGSAGDERSPVVLVDTIAGVVSRVHYDLKRQPSWVKNLYSCRDGDMTSAADTAWVNNMRQAPAGGAATPARVYEQHSQFTALCKAKILDKINQDYRNTKNMAPGDKLRLALLMSLPPMAVPQPGVQVGGFIPAAPVAAMMLSNLVPIPAPMGPNVLGGGPRTPVQVGLRFDQLPFLPNEWVQVYDARTPVAGHDCPPAHLYANGTVAHMRLLRKH